MIMYSTQSNSVDFSVCSSESSSKFKSSVAMTHKGSFEASYATVGDPTLRTKRSSSQSRPRSSSSSAKPASRSKQCNVCACSLNPSKTGECSHCHQATCAKHCMNKWKGQVICDTCHRNFMLSEMLGRGEIEDSAWLQAQLLQMVTEKEKWHEINQHIGAEIVETKQRLAVAEAKNRLELQKLKDQLASERGRNQSITSIVAKLTGTVEDSKRCESLTAFKTRDNQVQLEANRSEFNILADQVRQLSNKLSTLSMAFQGMISSKLLLGTVCRSCKNKVTQTFRRQILEGNLSGAFSTLSLVARSEVNRLSRNQTKQENCKCMLM